MPFNWSDFGAVAKDIWDNLSTWQIVIGAAIAVLWFALRRVHYPRANCSHRIEHYPITADKMLLRVVLVVENKGEVMVPVQEGFVRIYRMQPWPDAELLAPLAAGTDPLNPGELEVDWEPICTRHLPVPTGPAQVEPGETDEIPIDFIHSASEEVVIVYSYIKNTRLRLRRWRNIGWGRSTTYRLRESSDLVGGNEMVSEQHNDGVMRMVPRPDEGLQQGPKPERQTPPQPAPAVASGSKPGPISAPKEAGT